MLLSFRRLESLDWHRSIGFPAEELRELILSQEEGSFLGHESQLITDLNISRPTFRQVARLLQQEQLITIKRGANGGIYTRRPTITAVSHMASIYLKSAGATGQDILNASSMLTRDTVLLATQCQDESLRKQLQDLIDSDSKKDNLPLDVVDNIRSEDHFTGTLSAMCGNPAVMLFYSILYQIGSGFTLAQIFKHHPDRVKIIRDLRIGICNAILDNDAELGAKLWKHRLNLVENWFSETQENPPKQESPTTEIEKISE